jgi:DNA-binding CsgD family transcriptional regulator
MTTSLIALQTGKQRIHLKSTELEFLHWCCQDIPYHAIAKRMGKSPRTIDGYRDDLFVKLQVRSKTGLVLWCFKSGFLKRKDINLTGRNRTTKRAKK